MDFFGELRVLIGEALNLIVQLRTDLATALSQPQANQEQVNAANAARDKTSLAFQAYVEAEDLEDDGSFGADVVGVPDDGGGGFRQSGA